MTGDGVDAPSPSGASSSAAPGFVVAALSSGSGTTTVTIGLMAAMAADGSTVAPFVVGPSPEVLGPLDLASNRPRRSLDPVLVGESAISPLYAHGSAGCDVGIVASRRGVFDGRVDPSDRAGSTVAQGSAAHVAALLGMPVVLVVDARGYAQTLAAVIRGLTTHDPGTRIAGVVLNRVPGDDESKVLMAACESAGVPVVGTVPHVEGTFADRVRAVGAHINVAALRALAVAPPAVDAWDPVAEVARARLAGKINNDDDEVRAPVTIALAGGPPCAYAEYSELLAAAGARVVDCDPLVDPGLPGDASGFVFPGGFPEEDLVAAASNAAFVDSLATRVAQGMPVHAEYGGASSPYLDHYREGVATADSLLYREGERVTAYEPHRRAVEWSGTLAGEGAVPAWAWRTQRGKRIDEGRVTPSVHVSHLRVHPASHPMAVVRFVDAARLWRQSQSARPDSEIDGDAG